MSKMPALLILIVCSFTYFITATASIDAKTAYDYPYTINFDPIYIPGARSIGLYFEKLELSDGDELIILNESGYVLKTYTCSREAFSTEQFPGDTIKIRLRTTSCETDYEFEIEPYPEFEYNEEKECLEKNTALPEKTNASKAKCPGQGNANDAKELRDKCPSKGNKNANGQDKTRGKPAFTKTPIETPTDQYKPQEVLTSTDEDDHTRDLASTDKQKQETSQEQKSSNQVDDIGSSQRSELKSSTLKPNTVKPEPAQPAQTDQTPIEIHPYTQKTRVAVGEDNEYEISAYSTLPETVRVDIIVNPPPGVSVTSTQFVNYGAGMYIATCNLGPGDKYTMRLKLKANEPNDNFNVEAHAVYYSNSSASGIKEASVKIPFSAYMTDQTTVPQTTQTSTQLLYTAQKIILCALQDLEDQFYSYYYWNFT